jgi:MYXO-CTERM domain-containing protein
MRSDPCGNWLQRRTFVSLSAIAAFTSIVGIAEAVTVDDLQALTYPDGNGHTLPYRLLVPKGYDAQQKYRLVLFFHGAGERGTDNRNQLAGQTAPLVFADAANQSKYPVFMVAPQCPTDQQWVDMVWGESTGVGKLKPITWPMAAALALVDQLMVQYPGIDTSRLYVTGLSMGGYGTWDAIYRKPRKFRKAVAICGGYDPNTVTGAAGTSGRWFDIPIWDFHSIDDGTVPVGRSIEMLDAINGKGGMPKPKFTEYGTGGLPPTNHAAWVPAYADPGLLPWMFDNDIDVDAGVPEAGAANEGGSASDSGPTGQAGGSQADAASTGAAGSTGAGGANVETGGSSTTSGAGGDIAPDSGSAAMPGDMDAAGCACRAATTDRSWSRGTLLAGLAALLLGRKRRRSAGVKETLPAGMS